MGFNSFTDLPQVTQAQCMKTETEHYRRLQSELVQVRPVHCFGVHFSYVDNLEGSGLEGMASQRLI